MARAVGAGSQSARCSACSSLHCPRNFRGDSLNLLDTSPPAGGTLSGTLEELAVSGEDPELGDEVTVTMPYCADLFPVS
jgi:hypothetical protein